MKKFFTICAVCALSGIVAKAEPVADYVPEVIAEFYQELDQNGQKVSQVMIQVQYPGDVWWVSGCSQYCKLVDKDGNEVVWTPDFSGPSSDYSQFWYGINGLDKYVDMDYTLIIPEGIFGDTAWSSSDYVDGRCNPELRYEFNAWKLAGEPREDHTSYILEPVLEGMEVYDVSASAKEYRVNLRFNKPVVLNKNIDNMTSIRDAEGVYMSSAKIIWSVDKDDPTSLMAAVRYLNYTADINYTLYIGQGCIGNETWGEEGYSEGQANPEILYVLNPVNPKLPVYDFVPEVTSLYQEIDVDGVTTPQVCLQAKYPADVYWVAGCSGFCKVLDSEGNPVVWTPDFTAPASDYSMFWYGIYADFNNATNEDYTLVIPAGTFGDDVWEKDAQEGHTNPELRLPFNPAQLSGISTVATVEELDGPIYNLQGIRVNPTNLPAGIYISNGHKFIVR